MNLDINNGTASITSDIGTGGTILTTNITVSKKCHFCENLSVITIDYDGRELNLCQTHKDAIKGRLGLMEYIPYIPYTPVYPQEPYYQQESEFIFDFVGHNR